MDALPRDAEPGRSLDGDGLDRRRVSIRGTLGTRQASGPHRISAAARRWTLWLASAAMACVGALVVYQVLLSGLASGNEGLPDGGAPPGTSAPLPTTAPDAGGVPADPTSTGAAPTGAPSGTAAPVPPPGVPPTAAERSTAVPRGTGDDDDDEDDDDGDDGDDGDDDNSGHGSDDSGSDDDNSGPGSDG